MNVQNVRTLKQVNQTVPNSIIRMGKTHVHLDTFSCSTKFGSSVIDSTPV